jgi:hypothetical protein
MHPFPEEDQQDFDICEQRRVNYKSAWMELFPRTKLG